MKKSLLIAIAMLAITVFSACTAKQLPESTINLQLQNSVDSIVKQDMKEFAAQEGMVIVMETSTGNLRAVVGWKEDKGKVLEDTTLLSKASETFIKARRFYREAGITLLQDSVAKIGNLCIIGRDDRTNMQRKSLAMIMEEARKKGFISDLHHGKSSDEFFILLDHQPYHLEEAEQNGIDFQFSGHTHHGQVWPVSWVTDALYEKAYGSLQKGNTQYYISSGLGIWGGKFRIGTQSEYVVLTIEHK